MSPRLEHRRYSLAFREPVRTAHGPWERREGFLLRLENEEGRIGFGEVAPLPEFGTETVEQAEVALRGLGDRLDETALGSLTAEHPCTVAGLRTALAELERGDADGAQGANKTLRVAGLLPAGRWALERCRAQAELGFRIFKWKVGVAAAAEELPLLDDLLAALPAGSRLRLDANGAWDRRTAERWLERCADRPIEHLEQPVDAKARGAEDLLLGLADDYPTPLALDESLVSGKDVERWVELGWRGIFVIKPALIAELGICLGLLEKHRAAVVFSSALETGIGARLLLKTALGWGGEPRALGAGVWPLFADARFDGPCSAPFLSQDDLLQLNPDKSWNALT